MVLGAINIFDNKKRKEAGAALISMCQNWKQIGTTMEIGEYMGFKLDVDFDTFSKHFTLNMKGELSHRMDYRSRSDRKRHAHESCVVRYW